MISDKYEIVKQIAQTDHTSIYLVKHRQLQVFRIAKLVDKSVADYKRLIKEAMLIKDLKFKGLPIIYDIEEDDISICIIEEYIAGNSLEEYILKKPQLTVYEITRITISICEIMEYLHERALIAHLDIKPSNIMICETFIDGHSDFIIHIIDFDSSRNEKDNDSRQSYGTVGYAAPEQYVGKGSILSDIYSIGILMVYMANKGRIPSDTNDITDICHRYSNSIGPVIRRCLRHNQSQRYKSIGILKKDLINIFNSKSFKTKTAQFDEQFIKDVYVAGARRGIGVSHFCLCMASFLAKNGLNVMILRHGDNKDYKSDYFLGKMDKNGIIKIGKIIIVPEYSKSVDLNINLSGNEKYVRIHDCGTDYRRERKGISVLVCNLGYRRYDFERVDESDRDTVICLNHINGVCFYEAVKVLGNKRRFIRFPCMYEWNKKNELFEEAMFEIFEFHKKSKKYL